MNSTASKFSRAAPSDRYYFGATAILVLGIVLRQWGLGDAPFHPDETIHTFFSGGFNTYHYDPVYHGPLLYHLVAAVFGLFGKYDYTARLVPSLLGIGLLGLILGPMRQFLGSRGSLASAALIAVSPSVVSYSRRLLHDSLVLFLTLGAVWCFLVALENPADTEKGRNSRIGIAAFMTLFLATKANCFFIAAMLFAFYLAWLFSDLVPKLLAGEFSKLGKDAASRESGLFGIPNAITRWVPPLLFAIVIGASIFWPRDNSFTDTQKLSQTHTFDTIAKLCCVAFGLWIFTGPQRIKKVEAEKSAENLAPVEGRGGEIFVTYILGFATALWLYVFLFGNGAQILIQWGQTKHFPTQQFVDGGINARSAIFKMLEYWGGQQGKPRLPGRHDYYLVLALLYEVPVLLVAVGGIWHAAKNRSTFSDLLLWWAFSSWTIYAIANEKVPWLLVHNVLPLALLGGLWLGQVRWKRPVWYTATALGLIFSLRGVSGTNFERGGDNVEPMFYAQTPEAFRDALQGALLKTRGDDRAVWMANERQWPTVWYLRPEAPNMGKSGSAIGIPGVKPDPKQYRAAVVDEPQWDIFRKQGWTGDKVNFLIWPYASWSALEPRRYSRWFWTRDALPASERDLDHAEWKLSILSGKGEWSHATAIVGIPPGK